MNIGQPFFKVVFSRNDNSAVTLSDRLGPNRVRGVDLELSEKKLSSCKVHLVDVQKSIVDEDLFSEEVEFRLQYGIHGIWAREKRLRIKEMERDYEKSLNVTLVAVDVRVSAIDKRSGKVFSKKTASEIVTLIAQEMGWDTSRIVPTKRRYPTVAVGHRSYSQIISELAWEENYRFLVEENVAIFEPSYDLAKSRYRLYTYWIGQSPSVLRFKTRTSNVAAAEGKTKSKSMDSRTGSTNEANPDLTPSTGGGKQQYVVTYIKGGGYSISAVKKADEGPQGGAVDSHPNAGKERATAASTKAKWKQVEADLDLLNEPIEVGDVIEVHGVSTKDSGAYKVVSARFKIEGGALKIGVKLSRDTTRGQKGKKEEKTTPQESASKTGTPRINIKYLPGGGYVTSR